MIKSSSRQTVGLADKHLDQCIDLQDAANMRYTRAGITFFAGAGLTIIINPIGPLLSMAVMLAAGGSIAQNVMQAGQCKAKMKALIQRHKLPISYRFRPRLRAPRPDL